MILQSLSLQNFRSYAKAAFTFSPETTVVVGPNTTGKSNLVEAVYLLASGKSFRAEKDIQLMTFHKDITRVTGQLEDSDQEQGALEVLITSIGQESDTPREQNMTKRYFVNGVPKRRVDFAGILPAVLFSPSDLEIVIDGPSVRRRFLDDVLEQTDRSYRIALATYQKAMRQRNALLETTRELGIRNEKLFSYWDDMLIEHGSVITQKREALIEYLNTQSRQLISFRVAYDKSVISRERLNQYKEAEVAAGVTLVGPHRDDFLLYLSQGEEQDIRQYGSRGQQRLVVLGLKLLQVAYMADVLGSRPLLLLDDIFSELDDKHIKLVLDVVPKQQTIMTTTHKEFVDQKKLKETNIIELEIGK